MLYTREKVIKNKIPNSLAIILDGNGRWAKKRGLPRNIGHYMGAKNLVEITKECNSLGIKSLIVYAFSTENWKRPKEEVDFLMNQSVIEINKNTIEDMTNAEKCNSIYLEVEALENRLKLVNSQKLKNKIQLQIDNKMKEIAKIILSDELLYMQFMKESKE